jgi:hypothetical protein
VLAGRAAREEREAEARAELHRDLAPGAHAEERPGVEHRH